MLLTKNRDECDGKQSLVGGVRLFIHPVPGLSLQSVRTAHVSYTSHKSKAIILLAERVL